MSRRVLALVALIVSLAAPATAQADVTQAASGSGSGTGSATFSITVPAGTDRLLAVGVSTTDAVTVSSVTFGAQVLTRQLEAAADGARSEIWTLTAPNTGTANVVVTLSGGAPVVAGASSFTGVDQLNPLFPGAASTQNTSANSASLVLSGTVTRDGMFGTISIANAGNTAGLVTSGSIDLVVADARWATAQGNVRGGGATRSGNTGQNMAQNAGINWRWTFTNPQALNPYAQTLIGLRAGTGTTTAPTVVSPTATGVTHNTAVLGGNMTGTGGADITQRGVIYCTCATPTVGGAGVTQVNAGASNTTSTFTVNAGGLAASTQYTYRAFATNSAGVGYSAVANFTTAAPPNQSPTANAGGPYTAAEGAPVTLNGAGSSDPDGNPLTYAWDVDGDGQYDDATGVSPTVSAATLQAIGLGDGPDSASVRVRVNDGTVGVDSAATTLTVTNVAPSGTFTNRTVNEGATATIGLTGVTDVSPSDVAAGLRYAYDFEADGTYDVGSATYATASTATTADLPTALTADGPATRNVRIAVVDRDGDLNAYDATVTVTNVAPTATLTGATVNEGSPATLAFSAQADASAADTAAGFTYEYDLDDDGTFEPGGPTATLPAALTANGPATLDVHAAIIDRDGGRSEYDTAVTVANVAPTAAVSGPYAVPSSGAVSLEVDLGDASADDTLSATIDWGDGTTDTITGRGKQTVAHTYPRSGDFTVTVVTTDSDGAKSAPATHALSVAAAPAAPSPTPTPTSATSPAETKLTIDGLRVTPRCVRASNLRAVAAQRRTLSVRFRLSSRAPVRFSLQRWTGKRGAAKCPPATGKAKSGGRKIPGVYSPHTGRTVTARAGVNTVTLAATGRRGKLLRPGTYLLTVTSGTTTSRTKVWVLAN